MDVGHLVVSRCEGEQICLGDNIVIHIHKIRNRTVKIGVVAPLDVQIYRRELRARKVLDGECNGR